MNYSRLSIIAALLAICLLALAGVILISGNDRLALFLGVLSLILPALIGQLKADEAAGNTNGKLDARIQAAVHRANDARRRGDRPATRAEIEAGKTPPESPVEP